MKGPDKNTQQYMESSISSARPEELAMMMYNGLLKFIARAQEEIRGKSLEAAHNTLIRCQDIVFEFQYTLNLDYGVSNNLMLIYDYLYNRLIEANAKKDCAILDEVLGFVTELRDTWTEAVKISKEQKAELAAQAQAQAQAQLQAQLQAQAEQAAQTQAAQTQAAQTQAAQTQAAQTQATAVSAENAAPGEPAAASPDAAAGSLKIIYKRSGAQSFGINADAPRSNADAPRHNADAPPAILPQPETGTPAAYPSRANHATPAHPSRANPAAPAHPSRVNPAAAAQYAKVSKAKIVPQEIISIASK